MHAGWRRRSDKVVGRRAGNGQSAAQNPSSIATECNFPASVIPAAAVARMRDAIFALVAAVAGLPDALSICAAACSSTDFINETSSGLKSIGEIFVMLAPSAQRYRGNVTVL